LEKTQGCQNGYRDGDYTFQIATGSGGGDISAKNALPLQSAATISPAATAKDRSPL
jgi:hypothetical protein